MASTEIDDCRIGLGDALAQAAVVAGNDFGVHRAVKELRQEVQTLLALAESSDTQAAPDGMDVPAEIARLEDRLSALAQAKAKIEQRATEHHQLQQQEFQAKTVLTQ